MKKTALALAAGILTLATTAAHATDSLIAAFSIPAAACEPPYPPSGIDGMLDGSWNKILKGTLKVYCPMALYGHIDSYSFMYSDPDGKSNNSTFKIALVEFYTDQSGLHRNAYCNFSSKINGPSTGSVVKNTMACSVDLIPGRYYTFETELWNRSNQTQPVKFYGVDFKAP